MGKHAIKPMSAKHRQAVNYYLQGMSKSKAAEKSGFKKSTTPDVFARKDVRDEIDRRMKLTEAKVDMDRAWLLEKLRDVIEATPGELIEVDAKGRPSLNWDKLSPSLRKAISTVTVNTSKAGGKYKQTKTDVKITTTDKLGAIKEAGILLGLREEKKVIDIEDGLVAILTRKRQERVERLNDEQRTILHSNGTVD